MNQMYNRQLYQGSQMVLRWFRKEGFSVISSKTAERLDQILRLTDAPSLCNYL